MRFGKMLAAAVFACSTMTVGGSDGYVRTYTGPNIGNSPERARKVFDGPIEGYEVRAAAAGVFPEYRGVYEHINGSVRWNFHPVQQYAYVAGGKKRILAKLQSFRQVGSGEGWATVQMNVILEERDDGVYAWVNSMYQTKEAAYEWLYGRDLGAIYENPAYHVGGGTVGYDWRDIDGTFSKGYSIDHLVVRKVGALAKSGGTQSAVEGDLAVPGDTAYLAEGEYALAEKAYCGDISVDGTLEIRNPVELTLSGNMKGAGDVAYRATVQNGSVADTVQNGDNFFLTGDWKAVAHGRLLSGMTNCTGVLCGSRTGGDKTPAGKAYWRNDGVYASVQIYNKIASAYQTGVVVYFRQSGPDIQARITAHSFNDPYRNGIVEKDYQYGDIDFETMTVQTMTIPTARNEDGSYSNRGQVGLHSLGLHFREDAIPHYVRFTGENTMYTGAVTRVEGCADAPMLVDFASPADDKGLPFCGALEVGRNGHAALSKRVSGEYVKAFDGGVIYQGTNQCIGNKSQTGVILSNGTFVCGCHAMNKSSVRQKTDSYMYLNHVAFYDGSKIVGTRPRIGSDRQHGARWYVGGKSPSSASCGMAISSGTTENPASFVLDVENVTNDGKTDFSMTGDIVLFHGKNDEDYEKGRRISVIKTGAGTFSMENAYSPYMPTKVRGGVWRFGVSAAANAETDFHLEGGDLEVAPGVALDIGEIVPGARSRVVLGEGATLTMAEPSSEWPEGGVLDFTVPGGGSSVRIGDSPCVGAGYLAAMRLNGRRVMQNSTGHLRPVAFRMVVR